MCVNMICIDLLYACTYIIHMDSETHHKWYWHTVTSPQTFILDEFVPHKRTHVDVYTHAPHRKICAKQPKNINPNCLRARENLRARVCCVRVRAHTRLQVSGHVRVSM